MSSLGWAGERQCSLDENHCLSLAEILLSFGAPVGEEHAWALCYQCAKCFKNALRVDPAHCTIASELTHVLIHRDGHVHPNTIFPPPGGADPGTSRQQCSSEQTLVAGLGLVLYRALDFGLEEDEERHLSPELNRLIKTMTSVGTSENQQNEADDEGIESDADPSPGSSLSLVMQECSVHLGGGGAGEADSHYRAVCRALVVEALELSTFLEKVSSEGPEQISPTLGTAPDIRNLNFNDWARLWVQVVRELRRGVQLKKVCYTRKPIEYELTPYEALMEDIRAQRYKLKKVMVDGKIPHRVKKDAHAIILEFIRSRPPLRKASERKLAPPKSMEKPPREKLMESIKQGHAKLKSSPRKQNTRLDPSVGSLESHTPNTRRLIKVDFSALPMDDDDDDEDEVLVVGGVGEGGERGGGGGGSNNPWQRTGSRLSEAEIHQYCDTALQSYDLATQCPSRRASMRRHTVVVCETGSKGSLSMPQSRPTSRQTNTPSEESIATTLPEMTWSRTSLQDDLLHSKQWQEECLSLTLEEIVHIRSVLTKAELESLPVEGHVKEDAEKRKVCFLCMKTRFGIFGPWGQVCKLCKRTVCAKCYSKMRIPTEHFSHVPVVALSPSLLSPDYDPDDSFPRALVTKLMSSERNGVGSAPSSPKFNRSAPPSQMSTSLVSDGPVSLTASSPAYSNSDKWRIAKEKTLGRRRDKAEKLKGLQMTVCHDCKTMVIQIIKSSRTSRNLAIRNLTLDLSPVY